MNVDIIDKPKKNISEDIKVNCSSDVVDLKDVQAIRNALREHLLFIGLDNRNNVRNITLLGIGSSCNVIIDSKEIIRTALFYGSEKVILVHNHPSNDLQPSKDDLHLTNVTNEMLKVFNIKLQDHIIVTEKDYISIDKIQKFGKEMNIQTIENMQKGLILEENQRLKQEILDLQQKIMGEPSIKVISGECVGGYNDTLVYNIEINYYGTKEFVTVEKNTHDMQIPSETWRVYTTLELTDKDKENIIQVVSKDPPSIYSDATPKLYEDSSIEEIEM